MPPYPWEVGLLPDPLDAAFHWPPSAPWITNLGQLQGAKSFGLSQSVTFRPGIKIPLAPAQVRLSAGPQVQPWAIRELCHTVLVVHNQLDGIPRLFTSLLAVVYNKCQLPCLPPIYQSVYFNAV